MHRILGVGLPNVYLIGGYTERDDDEGRTVSYQKLDELYEEIARAVASRQGDMTSAEFRFLRKRLGMSQGQIGALFDKTEQAVAKWEKGHHVPRAEANILRFYWLGQFGRASELLRLAAVLGKVETDPCPAYVVRFESGRWRADKAAALSVAAEVTTAEATAAITKARSGAYTTSVTRDLVVSYEIRGQQTLFTGG